MAPATDPRVGQLIAGRYELRRVLARGGLGVVFVAWQRDLEREVAVKLLHPALTLDETAVHRFVRETKMTSRLNHPHVVPILDAGPDGADVFLVMPLLQGGTLEELLKTGPLPIERVASLMAQVASGLAHAHDGGIVHRDLKPSNIFVESTGRTSEVARILDFGVARLSGEGGGGTITASGMVSGSPAYMSPEQAAGEEVGPPSDLYALGCTMFQTLSGSPPFRGPSGLHVMKQQLEAAPPALDLGDDASSRAMAQLVAELLEKAPERRPPSARAVQARLVGLGSSVGSVTPSSRAPDVPGEPTGNAVLPARSETSEPPRANRRAFLVAGVGASAAVAGGWAVWGRRGVEAAAEPATKPAVSEPAVATVTSPAVQRVLPPLEALKGMPGWQVVVEELRRLGAPPFSNLWRLTPDGSTPGDAPEPVLTPKFGEPRLSGGEKRIGAEIGRLSRSRPLGVRVAARQHAPEFRLDFLDGTLYRVYVRLESTVDLDQAAAALNEWLGAPDEANWEDEDAGQGLDCMVWRFADVTVQSRIFVNPADPGRWAVGVLLVDPARHQSARDRAARAR